MFVRRSTLAIRAIRFLLPFQPCFCLCLGFVAHNPNNAISLRMTLHLSHIFLTLVLTFSVPLTTKSTRILLLNTQLNTISPKISTGFST